MNFIDPTRLWGLLVVVAVVGLYVAAQIRRRTYTVRFTNVELVSTVAPRRPGWRRHVPATLFLATLALLTVAWARPTASTDVPEERATVVLAVDVSLSMEATDISPNRLEAAREAALDFLDVVPPELNVGLVTFSGVATISVPPTTDRELVAEALDRMELAERTAIGEAIFASLDAIDLVPPGPDDEAAPAAIVLMSDGATTSGRPNEVAAEAAVQQGVPVSTIAFGTDGGTITLPEEPMPIPVPVDRPALEDIAATTDGDYYSAVTAEELEQIYIDIGSSVGMTTEEREITTWFVGGALLALLATGALSLVWFSRLP